MRHPSHDGEFAFKALVKGTGGWVPTEEFFFTLEEAEAATEDYEIRWPIELYDDGTIYVPAPEELE